MHGCVYFLPVIGFQLLPRLKAIHSQEISRPDVGMADAYPRLATRRTHSCLLHGRFWAGMATPNPIPLGFTLGNLGHFCLFPPSGTRRDWASVDAQKKFGGNRRKPLFRMREEGGGPL